MTAQNILFIAATKAAIRFPTNKGELSTEQLWDLPLQSKSGFDLDTVAKTVNAALRSVTEESFVSTTTSPAKSLLELKLDVVKFIIADKIAENEANRRKADNAAQRAKLIGILGDKQDEALKSLSPEELRAQIAALSQ
jgi:hypothetical protein